MEFTAEERRERAVKKARLERQRDKAIIDQRNAHLHPEFGSAFMRRYLPHYMREPDTGLAIPPAEWHPMFFATTYGRLGSGEAHGHLAPRGYAKSTIGGVGVSLAALGKQLKQYIWLLQDTQQQAKMQLEAILAETEENPLIRRDFPHLVPKLGKHNRPVANRDDDVVFASGQRIQAIGSGQKVRGRRSREFRPDLLLADDLENDEHVATKYQRDKLEAWFFSAVLPALAKNADVVYLGTLLHFDSLLARIREKANKGEGWHFHTYEAMHVWGDYSTSTWPEFWTPERLEEAKARMGAIAFAREYGHQVVDDASKLFPAPFRYDEPRGDLSELQTRIAVDPAVGEKKTNDLSAIAVVSKRRGKPNVYVRDVWMGRVRMKALIKQIAALYDLYGGIVVVETVQAQEWLKQELQDYGIPVRGVKPVNDKYVRAEPVALHYEAGFVYHAPHLRDSEFEVLLDQFPNGKFDDPVDAVVYGIRELAGESAGGTVGLVQLGNERAAAIAKHPRGLEIVPVIEGVAYRKWAAECEAAQAGSRIDTTPTDWHGGLRAAMVEHSRRLAVDSGLGAQAVTVWLEVKRIDELYGEKSPQAALEAGH